MPSAFLNKISKDRDISMQALESIYEKAHTIAAKKFDEDDPDFYVQVTSIFKNMMGMSSHSSIVALAKKVPNRIESVSQCFMAE